MNNSTNGAAEIPNECRASKVRRLLRERGYEMYALANDGPYNSQLTFWQGPRGGVMVQAFREENLGRFGKGAGLIP